MILLVNSGGEAAVPEWRALFGTVAPHLDVRWIEDPSVRPEDVAYVFCWNPRAGLLAGLPNLRLIISSGAGVDHITADPSWPRHVPIVRMGGEETGQRMGEYVCLAALGLLRGLPRIIAGQRAARWDHFDAPRTATEVRAGVMGMGNLGRRSAEMLAGLGFQVAGWSLSRKLIPGVESFAGVAERDAFLARSDLLVCLLPDTPDTRGAIRAETIARLPPGAGVINAGRGSHVVIEDLVAALDAGHLAGAVLDVFETEPLPDGDPVFAHPKIIVTPHLASLAARPARVRYGRMRLPRSRQAPRCRTSMTRCADTDATSRQLDRARIARADFHPTGQEPLAMNVATPPASLAGVSPQEWQVRCDLAALYRIVAHFRMTDLIYTHISARVPGPEHHFLINQYGRMFHEMRASDLVKIDLDGNVVESGSMSGRRVNAAGFTIHSAIHAAREDLTCVIHTHTAAGMAVAAQKHGLLPISQHALKFYGKLAYHGYEGIALDIDERERLVRDLGSHSAMILVNHGLLAAGRTIPEAFNTIYYLERACQAQVAAMSGGAELVFPPEAVRTHTARQFEGDGTPDHYEFMWESCLRLIEDARHDWRC